MELPPINEIRLDATTAALLDDIRLAAKKVEEELQQFEDVKQLRQAKTEEADAPTISLNAVKDELGL